MQQMPLKSVNLLIESKVRKETKEEIINHVLTRDIENILLFHTQGKAKFKTLHEILTEYDNPKYVPTEEEVIKEIEELYGCKVKRN